VSISAAQFQKKLLTWFDQHGRKSLPWQQDKTPYRVWISEIMLQQTQVATVIPYYEKFMQRFPSIATLAAADQDEVLHLWAGLGYYSRARNLHRAAKMVMTEFAGKFPESLDDLIKLPGIGQSTAGAILAIAFHQPVPILDGNVKRVLARLHAITDPINDKATENHLWSIATDYTPTKRAADYTQAIMDLGATLCVRGQPACARCPFEKNCAASTQNLTHLLPLKKATASIPTRAATMVILQYRDQILLQQRPEKGIWGGLFSFPELTDAPDIKKIRQFCRKNLQLTGIQPQLLTPFRHTFTHYHLMIHPVRILLDKKSSVNIADTKQIWYKLGSPTKVGLPKPIQSLLRKLS
jgi:A/G-specific adenine glycosylase